MLMKGQAVISDIIFVVFINIIVIASIGVFLCANVPGCFLETGAIPQSFEERFVGKSQAEVELNAYFEASDSYTYGQNGNKASELWFRYLATKGTATQDGSARDRAVNVFNLVFQNRKAKINVDGEEIFPPGQACGVETSRASRKVPVPSGVKTVTLVICR